MSGELSGGGESGGDLTTQGKGWDEGGKEGKKGRRRGRVFCTHCSSSFSDLESI